MPETQLSKAYLHMTLAGLCFALMLGGSKLASQQLDPLFVVWARGLGGSLILVPYMLLRKRSILGNNRKRLLLRSLLGTISVCFVFYSVSLIPVADAASIFKTSILYVPFFAAYFLKENFDSKILLISIIGFIGVLLVIQPGYSVINFGIIAALLAGFSQGLTYVTLRGLSNTESAYTVVLYFLMGGVVFVWPFISWPTLEAITLVSIPLMTTISMGLLGQIFLTSAYAKAPAGKVSPFLYSEVLFSAIFGIVVLAEWPNPGKVIGMVIICGCGIILASRLQRKHNR